MQCIAKNILINKSFEGTQREIKTPLYLFEGKEHVSNYVAKVCVLDLHRSID